MADDEETTSSELPISEQLGHYRITKKLGQGGMGAVYLAHEESLGRDVAIKVMPPELASDETFSKRFLLEAKAIGKLNHPNIIHIHFVGKQDDILFYAMEFVNGCSVADMVEQRGPLPEAEALEIVRQAALGLRHAHEQGIIHRDIKPDNLMVTRDSIIKVADFGLAKKIAGEQSTQLTGTMAVMGTPLYMSPEQALGETLDHRTDIYALGCTLYQMLSAKPPFYAESAMQIMMKHINEPPPPIEQYRHNLSIGARQILARMLAKSPKDRYETYDELVAEIQVVHAGRALPHRALPAASTNRPSAMKRALRYAEIAAVAAIVLGLAVWFFKPKKEKPPAPHLPNVATNNSTTQPPKQSTPATQNPVTATSQPPITPVLNSSATDIVSLSDLPEINPSVGWGRFGKNGKLGFAGGKDPNKGDELAIVVGGTPSPKGLGMNPRQNGESRVAYDLGKRHTLFEATAAINDTVGGSPNSPGQSESPLTFKVLGDGTEIWKSRPLQKKGDTQQCRVEVSDVSRLELVVECGGVANFAHAVWLEPRLISAASSSSMGIAYLSDLPEINPSVGVGSFGKNGQVGLNGVSIVFGGIHSPKGLGLHPPSNGASRVGYALNKKYATLDAVAAMNDSVVSNPTGQSISPLTFKVMGDGQLLWKSRPLQKQGESDVCRVDVSSVTNLELVVECPGVQYSAHAVWLEPRLTPIGGSQKIPAADDPARWFNAINLLPRIDPNLDRLAGTVRREQNALVLSNGTPCMTEAPYRLPAEYDVRMIFMFSSAPRPTAMHLTQGNAKLLWTLAESTVGFENVNGKGLSESTASKRLSEGLQQGRPYTTIVEVRKDTLRAYLDGKFLLEFKTDGQELSRNQNWALRDQSLLGFGTWDGSIRVTELHVREVTGKGVLTRSNNLVAKNATPPPPPLPTPVWIPLTIPVTALNADAIATVQSSVGQLTPQDGLMATSGWLRLKNRQEVGIPDDGRVPIPNTDGFFEVLVNANRNAILMSSNKGRYPKPATITLDPKQQGKYKQLAFLSAAIAGSGKFKLSLQYVTGAAEQKTLYFLDHAAHDRPTDTGADIAAAVTTHGTILTTPHSSDLHAQTVAVDAARILKSLTITYESHSGGPPGGPQGGQGRQPPQGGGAQRPQPPGGGQPEHFFALLFAVSGLPADKK